MKTTQLCGLRSDTLQHFAWGLCVTSQIHCREVEAPNLALWGLHEMMPFEGELRNTSFQICHLLSERRVGIRVQIQFYCTWDSNQGPSSDHRGLNRLSCRPPFSIFCKGKQISITTFSLCFFSSIRKCPFSWYVFGSGGGVSWWLICAKLDVFLNTESYQETHYLNCPPYRLIQV